jgi:hypothetical protein
MAQVNPSRKRNKSISRNLDIGGGDITFKNFKGINNVAEPINLELDELVEASNIDIDSDGRAKRRGGYTKKYTPSDKVHSLWSNDRICLFIEGATLKRLNTDYTATIIRSNVSNLPMEYVDVNENVYYSNASVNGWIDSFGSDNQFTTPTDNFKAVPPTGQHIEYYNGRIYIAKNETIWFTDGYGYRTIDMRMNAIRMKDEITMMKAVDDGIWISIGDINDRSSIIFLSGRTPEEFVSTEKANYGAIEGTAVKPKSAYVGDGANGKTVLWVSRKGICLGGNGGNFQNLTATRYEVPTNRYGSGAFRLNSGVPQFVASLWT